jgi:hypothetical protein
VRNVDGRRFGNAVLGAFSFVFSNLYFLIMIPGRAPQQAVRPVPDKGRQVHPGRRWAWVMVGMRGLVRATEGPARGMPERVSPAGLTPRPGARRAEAIRYQRVVEFAVPCGILCLWRDKPD